mgnify:FL=1
MSNKYFPDENITFDDLYFVCYMIERVARRIHQRNRYVIGQIGLDALHHELSLAQVTHCLNPEQVEAEWIEKYSLKEGDFDVANIDIEYTDKVPSPTQMGKVYARLVKSLDNEDNLAKTIMSVYDSPVCDIIDDYNTGAYYEPSYVQTRAVINGEF